MCVLLEFKVFLNPDSCLIEKVFLSETAKNYYERIPHSY